MVVLLALTVWNGQVATVADFAERMLFVRVEDGAFTARQEVEAPGPDAAAWRARCVSEGVTTLICGAISRHLHRHLCHAGITVIDGCAGPIGTVLAAWRSGMIATCQTSRPRCHRRRAGRRSQPAAPSASTGDSTMRVAISSTGSDAEALIDPRFGRSRHFLVASTPGEALTAHANPTAVQAEHGAGIRTAEFVAGLGVRTVITGAVGPKAMQVLRAAGIRIFACDAVPARSALERLLRGELQEIIA